ncbi:MAG: hypothetical protein V4727_00805 [Verrucomicrobiota bacterium]
MNIFILHRSDEQVCSKRIADLSQFGEVTLCSDKDDIKSGFKYMCSEESFPEITSWDTALSRLADDIQDTWFFENDVRWGSAALPELFQLSTMPDELIAGKYRLKEDQPDWYWWKNYAHYFPTPKRSFNPVCRLRASLIQKVLEFRSKNEGFVFHELLFASLSSSCFDLHTTKLMGPAFRWRPAVRAEEMQNDFELYHPIKDPDL